MKSLSERLDERLDEGSDVLKEVHALQRLATSEARFDGPREFQRTLSEGFQFNVNALVSRNLNVPVGVYMLAGTKGDKSTLVPTNLPMQETELFQEEPKSYEVLTSKLHDCWNKISRTLIEDEDSKKSSFSCDWKKDDFKRSDLAGSIKSAGDTLEDIGDTVGRDQSTIYRWMTGQRNPRWDAIKGLAKSFGLSVCRVCEMIDSGQSSHGKKKSKTAGSGSSSNLKKGSDES